jgi:nuclear pore complex protein Nup160
MHPTIARHFDQHLLSLAKKPSASDAKLDHLSVMHTVRLSQHDHRGAVIVLYDRLKLIRKSGRARSDPSATALRHVLLGLINLMSCVAPDEAYVLVDVDDHKSADTEDERDANSLKMKKRRRVIITLDDLRKEYQAVLDKCSRIERGDFDFGVVDDEDEDMDDMEFEQSQSRLNLSSRLSSGTGDGD